MLHKSLDSVAMLLDAQMLQQTGLLLRNMLLHGIVMQSSHLDMAESIFGRLARVIKQHEASSVQPIWAFFHIIHDTQHDGPNCIIPWIWQQGSPGRQTDDE